MLGIPEEKHFFAERYEEKAGNEPSLPDEPDLSIYPAVNCRAAFNLKTAMDRGDLTQSAGRE
ncbi:MAG: hypothetical protein WCH57_04085 [Verrucomicrobiota bacterium]